MTPRLNSTFQVGDRLPTYTVRAHNASIHSENKIHEDTVAKQYGFRGGLVPGVTVHAYMTRPFAERRMDRGIRAALAGVSVDRLAERVREHGSAVQD